MGGFVLLFRSLLDKGWASNPEYMATWVRLVLKASHAEHEVFVNGENVKLERGQFFTGRKALAKEIGLSDSKVERILGFFKREGMLGWVSTNKGRLITIKNYDRFQGNFGMDTQGDIKGDTPLKTGQQNKQQNEQPQAAPDKAEAQCAEQQNKQQNEQQLNSQRTATEHKQRTERTKRKEKEDLKDQIKNIELPDFLSFDLWAELVEHRSDIKKPFTLRAATMQLKQLADWHAKGHNIEAIIQNTISNGYQGLFEPKTPPPQQNQSGQFSAKTQNVIDRIKDIDLESSC